MILSNPPMAFPRKRPHSGGENLKIQSPLLKNSFSGGTVLEITEDYTIVSTNPLTEGVFSDSVGVARLREFEQFAPYVHLLNGQEVLPDGHITGDILPSTRVGGFLLDPVARADKRDANCKTKFLHSDITPSEREAIQKGNPFDGSLAYRCNLDKTPGISERETLPGTRTRPISILSLRNGPTRRCYDRRRCRIQPKLFSRKPRRHSSGNCRVQKAASDRYGCGS